MDNFFMSGLENGWFSKCFESYHLFGYVGDREKLQLELAKKSLARKIIERIAPKVSIATVINSISEIVLVAKSNKKTIAQEIINLVTEHESQKKVTEILDGIYKKGKKNGTYYTTISKGYEKTLFGANFNELQSRLVTVKGQLVHRDSVSQYSKAVSAALNVSSQEWLLSDYPPHGFVDKNKRFNGKIILLNEDEGFSEIFSDFLPFNREIGWYPYVRITGFFDASKIQTQLFPALSICFVEYRRPIMYREKRASLISFMESEFNRGLNYLDAWSDQILFSFLCPIIFKGSNLGANGADSELKKLISKFIEIVNRDDIPRSLAKYYDSMSEIT